MSIKMKLIAPCGMNCALCIGYQREKNTCPGCLASDKNKPKYCRTCIIRHCPELTATKSKYCFKCKKYPCPRLKRLDKRYRTRYGMSMIENLEFIKGFGIREFVRREKKKWACKKCGQPVSVHRPDCTYCGHPKNK
jgi:hypothetical protein